MKNAQKNGKTMFAIITILVVTLLTLPVFCFSPGYQVTVDKTVIRITLTNSGSASVIQVGKKIYKDLPIGQEMTKAGTFFIQRIGGSKDEIFSLMKGKEFVDFRVMKKNEKTLKSMKNIGKINGKPVIFQGGDNEFSNNFYFYSVMSNGRKIEIHTTAEKTQRIPRLFKACATSFKEVK